MRVGDHFQDNNIVSGDLDREICDGDCQNGFVRFIGTGEWMLFPSGSDRCEAAVRDPQRASGIWRDLCDDADCFRGPGTQHRMLSYG